LNNGILHFNTGIYHLIKTVEVSNCR